MSKTGFVSLVGSGPGDPELMTLKAVKLLQQADVVVFDRLVSPEILDLIPHGVGQISVGKSPGKHCVPQHQINEIIVSLALSGRRVDARRHVVLARRQRDNVACRVLEFPHVTGPLVAHQPA